MKAKSSAAPESAIDRALRSFEAAEANLEKLERLLAEAEELMPKGIAFGSNREYEELSRSYSDVLAALPKVDGWRPTSVPVDLNDLAQGRKRWGDFRRHLHFGLERDLDDIQTLDWPEVKAGLTAGLYHADEPVPVEVVDLADLAAQQPTGRITTQLNWKPLSSEQFERLTFSLISTAPGYENAEWLMRTNAPDRGRDLSAFRVVHDSLGGVSRTRVVIQCKHWPARSISVGDIGELKEQMALWNNPRVDVLVIATTGRFSADTVSWIEGHNASDHALRIEMWPESHLERLLAQRPALIGEFQLR